MTTTPSQIKSEKGSSRKKYLKEKTEPVLTELIQQLAINQPTNIIAFIYEWALEKLKTSPYTTPSQSKTDHIKTAKTQPNLPNLSSFSNNQSENPNTDLFQNISPNSKIIDRKNDTARSTSTDFIKDFTDKNINENKSIKNSVCDKKEKKFIVCDKKEEFVKSSMDVIKCDDFEGRRGARCDMPDKRPTSVKLKLRKPMKIEEGVIEDCGARGLEKLNYGGGLWEEILMIKVRVVFWGVCFI